MITQGKGKLIQCLAISPEGRGAYTIANKDSGKMMTIFLDPLKTKDMRDVMEGN